jgi:hypothetical protein
MTVRPERSQASRVGIVAGLLCVYVLNILTFGLFGFQWLYLAAYFKGRKSVFQNCLKHFVTYLVGAALLSLGIWCRSEASGYVTCPDGADMSRNCMWATQRSVYTLNYVLHYMGGGWCLVHFLMDSCSLVSWCQDLYYDREQLSVFGHHHILPQSPRRIHSYWFWLAGTWAIFTLTWAGFYPWNTNQGLTGLVWTLIGQVFLYWIVLSVYFHKYAPETAAAARQKTVAPQAVKAVESNQLTAEHEQAAPPGSISVTVHHPVEL